MTRQLNRFIHGAKALLCLILALYSQFWMSGCGSFNSTPGAAGAGEPGWIRVDLTGDHPLSLALRNSVFAGAKAIEVEPASRRFRLIYPEAARQISGGYDLTPDGPAVSLLSFAVQSSRVHMSLDAASSQVTTINTSDGHHWQPAAGSNHRPANRDVRDLQAFLDANAELMDEARQIDSVPGLLQLGHGPNLDTVPPDVVSGGGPKPSAGFIIETLFVMSLIVNLWWVAPLAVHTLIAVFTTVAAINLVLSLIGGLPGGSPNPGTGGAGGGGGQGNNGTPGGTGGNGNPGGQASTPIPPEIGVLDGRTVSAGASVTGPTPVLVAGSGTITWSLMQGPPGMTINSATGVLTWNVPVVGQYVILILATNEAGSDVEDWTLNVVLNLGWSDVGGGVTIGAAPGTVYSLAVFDDDQNGPVAPALYVGGVLDMAGGVAVQNIARWGGSAWTPLGNGLTGNPNSTTIAYAQIVFDEDGSGPNPPALFVGGSFTNAGGVATNGIARWNGSTWSAIGGGVTNSQGDAVVTALGIFDDDDAGPNQPALFAAGLFDAAGGVAVQNIAKWNGAQWSPLAEGIMGPFIFPYTVLRMAVYDADGTGPIAPALIVGGDIQQAGTTPVNGIASWNGTTWSNVGAGLPFLSFATGLAVFDEDRSGPVLPRLFLGGIFSSAGSANVSNLARFDGTDFSGVGDNLPVQGVPGVDASLSVMAEFDADDAGPGASDLYMGGFFLNAGSMKAHHVARWDGAAWSALGTGLGQTYSEFAGAFAVFDDDGPGGPHLPALYAGGSFVEAGGLPVQSLARWGAIP